MDKIRDLIEFGSETGDLDFKREQYPIDKSNPKKYELLKDIMAMANNLLYDECIIIIGVDDKKSGEKEIFPIEDYHDDSVYQQFISSNIEPNINFEYKQYIYNGKKIAYFRTFNNDDKPYLFTKEVKIKDKIYPKGHGFIRKGSATEIIGRKEFDRIYEIKYSAQDRSDSIEILFGSEYSDAPLTSNVVLDGKDYLLNIYVKNTGNKSLTIHDIEAEIHKSSGLIVRSHFDLKVTESQEKYRKKKNELYSGRSFTPSGANDLMRIGTSVGMRDYSLTYNGKYYTLTKFLQRETYLIPQRDKDLMLGGVLLSSNEDFKGSKIKVTIRSDDFKEPFIKEYEIIAP